MAEVMSLIFMVFMVIPVIAPGIGQVDHAVFGNWHMIFVFMAGIALGYHHLDGRAPARDAAPGRPPPVHPDGRSPTASASC